MPELAQTLGDAYGVLYERRLAYLLIAETWDRASVDPALFHDSTLRLILEQRATLSALYGGAPRQEHVEAALRTALRSISPDSARQKEYVQALSILGSFRKQPPPDPAERRFIEDSVRDYVRKRAMFRALEAGVEHWERGDQEAIVEAVLKAASAGESALPQDIGLIYNNTPSKLARYKALSKSSNGVPMGIPIFDDLMRGGPEPGGLYVVLAPTGRGKTMTMVNIGTAALIAGVPVAHVTIGDIDEETVALRYEARMSGVPVNELAKNTNSYFKQIASTTASLRAQLAIKEYGTEEASVEDLRAYLKTLINRTGVHPRVLLVDYADLLRPSRHSTERREMLGDIILQLRQLGKDFNMVVWTASQTGRRSFTSERVTLTDVWECLEKVMHADVVISLCQSPNEKLVRKMRVLLLKNRLGGHEGHIVDCITNDETQTLYQNSVQVSHKMSV